MTPLQDLPIKRKVTRVIVLTCSVVLLLACAALAIFEVIAFRRALVRDMTVLADILGKNTRAALAFQDDKTAAQTLQALQSEPHVAGACLYARDGTQFAVYSRSSDPYVFPSQPAGDSYSFERGHLALFRPVVLNDKSIGTIFLRVDLGGIYERLRLFGWIALAVLIGSILVAFALSSQLQRPISRPILALAESARSIAERKDYSVRAVRQGADEVGVLTDAFNQVLTGIEERESALREANESLHKEIAERKGAEERVQAQLTRLELLNRIARAIGERQDLHSIYQVVIQTLEDRLPADLSCMCLYHQATHVLIVAKIGVRSEERAAELGLTEHAHISVDQNGLSRCVHGHLVYEPDTGNSEFPFPQRLADARLRSLVLVPLLVESTCFGVLVVARAQRNAFSSGECEFLRQLSEQVALAAHQAELYGALQSAYDDLRQTQQSVLQQERLRALGQMASGIAHDINNAISPVALYTESLLETEPNLSVRARKYLETIAQAIDDVARTVGRMREFYRQRESELALVPAQLNSLVEQVVDLTRAKWGDMSQRQGIMIELRTELAPDLPAVLGVESEIREALTNLIFNAVDAMPKGGTLTVRTGVTNRRTSGGVGDFVHLEVSDTGVGMDEDTRRRCLELFFTTKGDRGTGLGLAMVYGMAQRHNADIEIRSELGQGTTFHLKFPAATTGVAGPGQTATEGAAPSDLRILIVDDDPLLLKSLRDALETDGHMVVSAPGGQAGIDAFRAAQQGKDSFAVVITDLGMPYVDGRTVASSVKSASPSTPVILLTGWGQRLVAEGDIPPNVDCVLSKPPKLRELRTALSRCVSTGPRQDGARAT